MTRLDEEKIAKIESTLEEERSALRTKMRAQGIKTAEREQLREKLQAVDDRLGALSRIVARNIATLDGITKKVFVSSRQTSPGIPERWNGEVLEKAASESNIRFVHGDADPGEMVPQAILRTISESYCFLAIVDGSAMVDKSSPAVSPYILEEIGVAFALAKPMIIAVEKGAVAPRSVGRMLGDDFRRIEFTKTDSGCTALATHIVEAVERAFRQQDQSLRIRREIAERIFN